MKKSFFAVMAFALLAGLTSCNDRNSMEELTVQASLLGDTIAQFKCTFSPTVSDGYLAFYSGEQIPAELWDEVFANCYGKYETFTESKTLYSYWLTKGRTYYFYAMTFTEKGGKATLGDVVEVRVSTQPSNGPTQALDVEWNSYYQRITIKVPTEFDNDYVAVWNSDTFAVEDKYYTMRVQMNYTGFSYATPYEITTVIVGNDNKFYFEQRLPEKNTSYTYFGYMPVGSGGCNRFCINVMVYVFDSVTTSNGGGTYISPASPVQPNDPVPRAF